MSNVSTSSSSSSNTTPFTNEAQNKRNEDIDHTCSFIRSDLLERFECNIAEGWLPTDYFFDLSKEDHGQGSIGLMGPCRPGTTVRSQLGMMLEIKFVMKEDCPPSVFIDFINKFITSSPIPSYRNGKYTILHPNSKDYHKKIRKAVYRVYSDPECRRRPTIEAKLYDESLARDKIGPPFYEEEFDYRAEEGMKGSHMKITILNTDLHDHVQNVDLLYLFMKKYAPVSSSTISPSFSCGLEASSSSSSSSSSFGSGLTVIIDSRTRDLDNNN